MSLNSVDQRRTVLPRDRGSEAPAGSTRGCVTERSSRLAIVVIQHATQSLSPPYASSIRQVTRRGSDQAVAQPLVVAFVMIMRSEFVNRFAQRALAEENHPLQTRFF